MNSIFPEYSIKFTIRPYDLLVTAQYTPDKCQRPVYSVFSELSPIRALLQSTQENNPLPYLPIASRTICAVPPALNAFRNTNVSAYASAVIACFVSSPTP